MSRPLPLSLSIPSLRRPVHRASPQEVRERDILERAAEDAVVASFATVIGVHPTDPPGQPLEAMTAADARYLIRAAYRHGKKARG